MIRACQCAHLEEAHSPTGCMHCPCNGFQDATTEFTRELYDLASTGLAILKRELERKGHIKPFFILRHTNGKLDQFDVPDPLAKLFNSDDAKTRIFGVVRDWVRIHDINAVIIATDAWQSHSTPKAMNLSFEFFARLVRDLGTEECEKRGLVVRREACVVSVQTPERAMSLSQVYERLGRREIVFREITQIESVIDKFVGRQKMFGRLHPEDIR